MNPFSFSPVPSPYFHFSLTSPNIIGDILAFQASNTCFQWCREILRFHPVHCCSLKLILQLCSIGPMQTTEFGVVWNRRVNPGIPTAIIADSFSQALHASSGKICSTTEMMVFTDIPVHPQENQRHQTMRSQLDLHDHTATLGNPCTAM